MFETLEALEAIILYCEEALIRVTILYHTCEKTPFFHYYFSGDFTCLATIVMIYFSGDFSEEMSTSAKSSGNNNTFVARIPIT